MTPTEQAVQRVESLDIDTRFTVAVMCLDALCVRALHLRNEISQYRNGPYAPKLQQERTEIYNLKDKFLFAAYRTARAELYYFWWAYPKKPAAKWFAFVVGGKRFLTLRCPPEFEDRAAFIEPSNPTTTAAPVPETGFTIQAQKLIVQGVTARLEKVGQA